MSTVQIALTAMTRIVQAVLRSTDERSLLKEACAIIVDAGYRFSWVGEAEHDEEKKVRPMAWAGHEDGYLSAIKVSWDDSQYGRGPTGTAIRTGKAVVIPDMREAAEFSIWLNEASKRGYRSCCALPLMDGETAFAALSISSGQAGAFGEQEMPLLANLAEVLAFGIMNLRGRQKAEATIQQREEQLRQAVSVSKLGIFDHDHLTGKIYASEEHQRIYGVGPDDAFNVSLLLSRIYPGDHELVTRAIERAHDPAGDGLYEVEHRVVRPDGSIRWLTTRAQTFFEGEKSARRPVRTIGAVADITERRQAEEALRQREEQLRQAVQVSQLGVFDHDHQTDSVYCSPECRQIFGLAPDDQFILPVVLGRIHTEDRERTLNIIKAAHAPEGTGTHEMEYRVVRPDGSMRWVTVRAQTYFEGEGSARRAVRTVGAVADITERRQAEEKYRGIFDHAVVGIFQSTPEGRYLSVNPALARMWGYDSPQEMITTVSDIGRQEYVVPGQREEFKRLIEERGVVSDYEYEFYRKDGSRGWTRVNARVVRDARGKTLYYEGTDQDITEQKRAIDALRESEKRLSDAQRIARMGNWDWDIATNALYWSDEIYRIFGVQPQQFGATYEAFLGYVHAEDREFVDRSVHEAFQGRSSYDIEHRVMRPDGETRTVHSQGNVFRDGSGKAVRMAGTVQDVTENKRLEAQFKQAQKMEAVGRLAGGVAHDFNNLLSVIMGYTDLAGGLIESGKPAAAADKISQIRRAAERGASLTRQLLAFSRRQMVHPQILDLNKVVSSSSEMLKRLVGEDVSVTFQPGKDPWLVKVDPGQIEQILMNLTVNARDAMPTGGRIVMETANIEADEHFVSQHPLMLPGAYVMLSFADTGAGIAPENLPLIFEPFFTTKETGKGTGLGLATVYGIVKQNNGSIWVYSEPDKGTVFRICFPKAEGAETHLPAGANAEVRRGTETVLLVEDEAQLRDLTATLLEEGGYQVLRAENGPAALALAENSSARIDLLLTDVIMPGMSGVELCGQMQKMRPGIRILCMSGYTGDHLKPYGQFESEKTFLQKPFSQPILLKKVRAVLDA
ncbi:MAG: PAS domain-containing protein [Acidobacteriia bacterium]|nr:PAS domain-containing protein [Terriglobia bacterium]